MARLRHLATEGLTKWCRRAPKNAKAVPGASDSVTEIPGTARGTSDRRASSDPTFPCDHCTVSVFADTADFFGNVSSRTPSVYFAWAAFESTSEPSVKARATLP